MPSSFGTVYEKIQSTTAAFTYASGAPTATAGLPDLLLVDTTAGNITVTLPASLGNYSNASNGNGPFRIQNIGATGFVVNVASADGTVFANSVLAGRYASEAYTSDGVTGWFSSGGAGSVGGSYEVQTTLSSAQILALNATPVTIVPAPGASKAIVVESIAFKMIASATAYASGGVVTFQYAGGAVVTSAASLAAALVTAGAGTVSTSLIGLATALTNTANTAITITNATGAFTTGTGTAVVTTRFHIVGA
jgi:hypothetical protein